MPTVASALSVDDLPVLVHRPVHIPPAAADLDIRLVDIPAIADRLGQQRSEPVHPPVDRDVIDVDTALGQQLLDIAVGQPEPQGTTGPPGGNWNRANAEREVATGRALMERMPESLPRLPDWARCNRAVADADWHARAHAHRDD